MEEVNTPVDINILMNHPPGAASKRTLSNGSERRYRESVNSMLDEIDINESTERLFKESVDTADFGKRLKESVETADFGKKAKEDVPSKPVLPIYYHKRTRSCALPPLAPESKPAERKKKTRQTVTFKSFKEEQENE